MAAIYKETMVSHASVLAISKVPATHVLVV
jgi:hypothetical protein